MKKLFSFLSLLSLFIPFFDVAKGSEYKFFKTSAKIIDNIPTLKFYGVSSSGTETLLNTWESSTSFVDGFGVVSDNTIVDQYEGKIYYELHEQINSNLNPDNDYLQDGNYSHKYPVIVYDLVNDTVEKIEDFPDEDTTLNNLEIYPEGVVKMISEQADGSIQIGNDTDDFDIVSDGLNIEGAAIITKNADGSIQIGADGNDIDITSEGLTVDGVSLITKKDSGEIHIGKNSLITKEEDGVQKLYAQDEDGDAININVTNGSKLLIDGIEVTTEDSEQVTTNKNNISTNTSDISTNTSNISTNTSNISTNTSNINSLGEGVAGSTALTAALTALPQSSKNSKHSCGIGTGAYSSRYAIGFGCASKVSERVDINAGGSYVFGGSKSYGGGTLDSGVIKAGFVFKLGELNTPTQISMEDTKKMETKIESLEEKNKQLLSRLERLEKIALSENSSKDLAIYKLK